MSYFQKFPIVSYNNIRVRDISRNVKIKDFLRTNISFFQPYRVKSGETPEMLAYDFYGDANLHWIILLINNIIDPFFGWILSDQELISYVDKKYGVGQSIVIRHWELNGIIVKSGTVGAVAITNFEYEEIENEKKREIKIVRNEYIDKVVAEFEDKILS